ncbi:MAG: hypothetical protein IKS07_00860 [Lachnospiraceae bacterium]|nr:hypothetical protein [Lachnospiraceae bacterium]
MRRKKRSTGYLVLAAITLAATGCGSSSGQTTLSTASTVLESAAQATETSQAERTADTDASEATDYELIVNSADGEHAITADAETAAYTRVRVEKTGEADGDEADFYGENAAIFATNGAELTLTDIQVDTDGTHANAVFSYGEGTTVNISDSTITTGGNCSGGLMTTGGGTMNARNLQISTSGNSSAAIRSDRGGGTVTVTGGDYETSGKGSPVIYSTADITVSDANLTSTASQGVVVEGKNSVTLNDVTLTACNNTKNSDKSDYYQAVMIYQSMSGDADEGLASFTMNGGSLTNQNGDIFFVNNTRASISLNGASIVNEDSNGVFLRAAAAGWGSEGSNGGLVDLTAAGQVIDGNMLVDEVSVLNLYLTDGSAFCGAINPDGASGQVYAELTDGSVWVLTADSYISSLTCDADSIDLNGYTLYVNGTPYTEGTASKGDPIEVTVQNSGRPDRMGDGNAPGGTPPDGEGGDFGGDRPEGTPPDGMGGDFGGDRPEGTPPDGFGGGFGGNPPEGNPPEGNPPDGEGGGSAPKGNL